MKKLVSFLLVLTFVLCLIPAQKAKAVTEFTLNYPNVAAAMLVEYKTGKVLYAHNIQKQVPIASVTKIMTLILGFEAIESGVLTSDKILTVSAEASSMGGSEVFLNAGEEISVEDTFKSIIVASANDACVVLAEAVAGSSQQFVAQMNEKAKELGMKNTLFVNCTGLPASGHYSTAEDVALMSRELLKHEDYFRWSTIWTENMTNLKNNTMITNTNKLIRFYTGCDGLKTGFTNEAKYCISATAQRGGERFIAVVLGMENSDDRFSLAKELLNYGFSNYKTSTVIEQGQSFEGSAELIVRKGKKDTVTGVAAQDVSELVEMSAKPQYTVTSVPNEVISAPIKEGDVIGKFIVYSGDTEIAQVDMLAAESIDKLTLGDYIKAIFARWVWV